MFAVVLPAVAVAAAWLNRRGIGPLARASDAAAPWRLSFGVRDLLLVMLLIGLVCFGATVLIDRRNELDWKHLIAAAPSIWLLAVLCYLLVFARRRRIAILLAIAMAISLTAALELWVRTGWGRDCAEVAEVQDLSLDILADLSAELRIETFVCQLITGFVFCLILTGSLSLVRTACVTSDRSDSGTRPRAARVALCATTGFCGLAAVCLYWQMVQPVRLENDDSSTPNSYPKLLEIAKSVEALNPNASALQDMMLAASLDQQTAAKELADSYAAGMQLSSQPGHMPFYADAPADDLNSDGFSPFRHLARAWEAEGDSLAMKGDLAGAARLSHSHGRCRRRLCKSRADRTWHGRNRDQRDCGLRLQLDPPGTATGGCQRRACAFDSRGPRPGAVVERDRMWVRNSEAWRSRLGFALAAWGRPGMTHPEDSDYRFMFDQRDATLRLLILDLAVRLYRDEQGHVPADLQDLVPRYLPSIPLDPFSGEAMIYRIQDRDFLVYSLGRDRTDNGGRIGTRIEANSKAGFDWGLEFLDEPVQ